MTQLLTNMPNPSLLGPAPSRSAEPNHKLTQAEAGPRYLGRAMWHTAAPFERQIWEMGGSFSRVTACRD